MFASSSFIPTMRGKIRRADGYTETGAPKLSSPQGISFSPIRLEAENLQTSIRTDRSGSQARAEEATAKGRILISPHENFKQGDMLILLNQEWRIDSMWPRTDMDGQVNHYQVDISAWG